MSDTEIPGEFELIKRYLAPLSIKEPGAYSLTDEADVIASRVGQEIVITMDTLVSGIHFLPDTSPEHIAAKVVRVNISDLAAMGALPAFYTLSLALPKSDNNSSAQKIDGLWLERFSEALAIEQKIFDVSIIGGDTVSTPGPLTLTITAFGYVETGQAIRRATARAGDLVVVSGTIGDAAFGLLALKGGLERLSAPSREIAIERHNRPKPQIELGIRLRHLASSAIDVSDGLIQDLNHICTASGVSAVIELEKVPISPAVSEAITLNYGTKADVLCGGDDYQLLFTIASSRWAELQKISKELGVNLTVIGKMSQQSSAVGTEKSFPEASAVIVVDGDGSTVELAVAGFRHF